MQNIRKFGIGFIVFACLALIYAKLMVPKIENKIKLHVNTVLKNNPLYKEITYKINGRNLIFYGNIQKGLKEIFLEEVQHPLIENIRIKFHNFNIEDSFISIFKSNTEDKIIIEGILPSEKLHQRMIKELGSNFESKDLTFINIEQSEFPYHFNATEVFIRALKSPKLKEAFSEAHFYFDHGVIRGSKKFNYKGIVKDIAKITPSDYKIKTPKTGINSKYLKYSLKWDTVEAISEGYLTAPINIGKLNNNFITANKKKFAKVVSFSNEVPIFPKNGHLEYYKSCLKQSLKTTQYFKAGNFKITPQNLTFLGITPNPIKKSWEQKLKKSCQGITIKYSTQKPLKDTACQDKLNALLAQEKILFTSGGSEIKPKSFPLLNKLALTLGRCYEQHLKIEGHTDTQGKPKKNKILSNKRAESVKIKLKEYGLKENRMTTIGMGETRPISKKRTAKAHAKNRRIEFYILTKS